MKFIKYIRYLLLFLAVILVPTSLASLFPDVPNIFAGTSGYFISSIVGYAAGYALIYGFMRATNATFKQTVYSKRMRTTYLITNAIIALLLLYGLGYSVSLLFTNQPIMLVHAILCIGFPWLSVQMLLLLFFVRSESLYR